MVSSLLLLPAWPAIFPPRIPLQRLRALIPRSSLQAPPRLLRSQREPCSKLSFSSPQFFPAIPLAQSDPEAATSFTTSVHPARDFVFQPLTADHGFVTRRLVAAAFFPLFPSQGLVVVTLLVLFYFKKPAIMGKWGHWPGHLSSKFEFTTHVLLLQVMHCKRVVLKATDLKITKWQQIT